MSQETERYQLENNGNTYLVRTTASSGGADVEANPEGTATEDLTKLKVDDTIYGIESGISQDDADARYLKLAGGTMTGNIDVSVDNFYIRRTNGGAYNGNIISKSGDTTILGSDSNTTNNVMLVKGANGKAYTALSSTPSTNLKYEIYDESNGVGFRTTAPTADYTKGGIQIVVLTSEPATRYNGYLYIITA